MRVLHEESNWRTVSWSSSSAASLEESRRANLPAPKLRLLEAIIFEDQGHVDYDSERWDAAAEGYLHAFELDPNNLEALRFAAQSRFAAQDWQRVVNLYTQYLDRVPGNVINYPDAVANLQKVLASPVLQ